VRDYTLRSGIALQQPPEADQGFAGPDGVPRALLLGHEGSLAELDLHHEVACTNNSSL
jgi:hypothetical protein